MNKKLFSILILASVIFVAVFGFWNIGAMNHSVSHACPLAFITGDCAETQGVFALATHHIEGLLEFSQATIEVSVLIFTLILIALASALLIRVHSLNIFRLRTFFNPFSFLQFHEDFKETFLRWLSFHNKRNLCALQMGASYEFKI